MQKIYTTQNVHMKLVTGVKINLDVNNKSII
jgi:hypothetical protein